MWPYDRAGEDWGWESPLSLAHWNLLHTILNVNSTWQTSHSNISAQPGELVFGKPRCHLLCDHGLKRQVISLVYLMHIHGRSCCNGSEPPDGAAGQGL